MPKSSFEPFGMSDGYLFTYLRFFSEMLIHRDGPVDLSKVIYVNSS